MQDIYTCLNMVISETLELSPLDVFGFQLLSKVPFAGEDIEDF